MLGRRDELLGDHPLTPLETPALLTAGDLLRGLVLQIACCLVEADLHLSDGVRRHHLQGGQVGDVDHLDTAVAAAQQADSAVKRPDGGCRPVVTDDEVQLGCRLRVSHGNSRG